MSDLNIIPTIEAEQGSKIENNDVAKTETKKETKNETKREQDRSRLVQHSQLSNIGRKSHCGCQPCF